MLNLFHQEILQSIKERSGTPTQHTFLDSYLGNSHPRYSINAPTLRTIAKIWMKDHHHISSREFSSLLTSLIEGISSTEKCMAGILMDYATAGQREFDPKLFNSWLDHLAGWAEVDAVCTGKYTIHQLPPDWNRWSKLLDRFSKSKNIHKRRASLVFLCSPIRHSNDERLAKAAIQNVERLKQEKDVLITKAISWILRSMVKHHKKIVAQYVKENKSSLPSIAVRETLTVLKTGKKTRLKKVRIQKPNSKNREVHKII
jgi:3-methyladenine DNA glycosylase AlkD